MTSRVAWCAARALFLIGLELLPRLASADELPAGASGRLVKQSISSRYLGAPREVSIYLPAEYQRQPTRRFPVLYLQHGQNLLGRGGWDVCTAVDCHGRSGRGEPVIVVGIPNAGRRRIFEYTPSVDPAEGKGGGASTYVRFVADELKPWVDRSFRTLRAARDTGIGGSSLGGLLALHAGLTRPEVFGRVMAMSPSVWWNDAELLRRVQALPALPRSLKVYIDSGGSGPCQDGCSNVFRLRDLLAGKKMEFGKNLWHWFEQRHAHDENAWRERLPRALGVLFPAAR